MGKIGMPVALLKMGTSRGKHSGNALAFALEAMEERYTSDPDVDRSLTKNNIYGDGMFTSGLSLFKHWMEKASEHVGYDKLGRRKAVKKNANIAMAMIVKPDTSIMNMLRPEHQKKLLMNCYDLIKQEYDKLDIVIDAYVIHLDEANPHMHIFSHDTTYTLSDKINSPKFFIKLNKDIPEKLRAMGWTMVEKRASKELFRTRRRVLCQH